MHIPEQVDSSKLIILNQSSMITANIEMKSSDSEAALRGEMVEACRVENG